MGLHSSHNSLLHLCRNIGKWTYPGLQLTYGVSREYDLFKKSVRNSGDIKKAPEKGRF